MESDKDDNGRFRHRPNSEAKKTRIENIKVDQDESGNQEILTYDYE